MKMAVPNFKETPSKELRAGLIQVERAIENDLREMRDNDMEFLDAVVKWEEGNSIEKETRMLKVARKASRIVLHQIYARGVQEELFRRDMEGEDL